eukprot:12022792-Prorocentrum_lima.AAC.1
MTSSLVGSEMCIRDSSGPIPRSGPWGGGLEMLIVSWKPCSGTGPAGTVSYTHLTLPTICSV